MSYRTSPHESPKNDKIVTLGTHEFHTMGIRALKRNCVESLKIWAIIFSFTLMAQNSTHCVKIRENKRAPKIPRMCVIKRSRLKYCVTLLFTKICCLCRELSLFVAHIGKCSRAFNRVKYFNKFYLFPLLGFVMKQKFV